MERTREPGVPGFDVSTWAAVIVPAGVPGAVMATLNAALNKALAAPLVKEKLPEYGLEIAGGTAQEFAAHISSEVAKWADVVERSGAKVD